MVNGVASYHTQLSGSTAAALHYKCLSRVTASLTCRVLKIPRIGYYGDFGIILPESLMKNAFGVFASFNKALIIISKEKKSGYGALTEFLGMVIRFRNDGGSVLASLPLAEEKIQELVKMIEEPAGQNAASLARLQKLAGRLRFTRTAVMGRFGRAAVRAGGGVLSPVFRGRLRCRVRVNPAIMPRLVLSYQEPEASEPFRFYSDATGDGKLASATFAPRSKSVLPGLLKGASEEEPNTLAASTNPMYIYELFAMVASVFQLREQLIGKRAILFADNEAACAALTTGAAKVSEGLLLAYAPWAIAAEHDVRGTGRKGFRLG